MSCALSNLQSGGRRRRRTLRGGAGLLPLQPADLGARAVPAGPLRPTEYVSTGHAFGTKPLSMALGGGGRRRRRTLRGGVGRLPIAGAPFLAEVPFGGKSGWGPSNRALLAGGRRRRRGGDEKDVKIVHSDPHTNVAGFPTITQFDQTKGGRRRSRRGGRRRTRRGGMSGQFVPWALTAALLGTRKRKSHRKRR